jgi:hypothetical protein
MNLEYWKHRLVLSTSDGAHLTMDFISNNGGENRKTHFKGKEMTLLKMG